MKLAKILSCIHINIRTFNATLYMATIKIKEKLVALLVIDCDLIKTLS
jgi:hypothetical protein